MPTCRLCGKSALEINGWLQRVNEKGVTGIWECRPSCDVEMSFEERIMGVIDYTEEMIKEEKES